MKFHCNELLSHSFLELVCVWWWCGDVACGKLVYGSGVSGSIKISRLNLGYHSCENSPYAESHSWCTGSQGLFQHHGSFVITSSALRILEGVGTACLVTAIFSTIPHFFPKSVGMIMVCYFMHLLSGCLDADRVCLSWAVEVALPGAKCWGYSLWGAFVHACSNGKINMFAIIVWWVSTAVLQFWWCCAHSYDSKWLSDQESVWVTWQW